MATRKDLLAQVEQFQEELATEAADARKEKLKQELEEANTKNSTMTEKILDLQRCLETLAQDLVEERRAN